MKSPFFVFILSFVNFVFSCSAQRPLAEVHLGNSTKVLMLNKQEAAEAITTDKTYGYFQMVNASEMSIQMKRGLRPGETRDDLLPEYFDYLKNDVEDFTSAESQMVSEVMEDIYKTTESVAKGIFPQELKLIKTSCKHVGEGVYYTRDNCIIIPKNELTEGYREKFTATMYHELFHVYSRLNPNKQKELYAIIGFENVGFENLELPETLAKRVLYNPDGVNFAQKITLNIAPGKTIDAVPVLFSNNLGHKSGRNDFFGYVEFNLYQIVPEGGKWKVQTQADGLTSTLQLEKLPDFFRQIRDNTHYIIHPDEVLADNFTFIMMAKKDPKVSAKFSPEGKELLLQVEAILKGDNSFTKGGRDPKNGSNR